MDVPSLNSKGRTYLQIITKAQAPPPLPIYREIMVFESFSLDYNDETPIIMIHFVKLDLYHLSVSKPKFKFL